MKIQFDLLEEIGNEVQAEDVRGHYSGRAMFGSTCPALVLGSESELVGLGIAIEKIVQDEELKTYLARRVKWDSMGYSTVVYWETLTAEGAPDDEDEDDWEDED